MLPDDALDEFLEHLLVFSDGRDSSKSNRDISIFFGLVDILSI